MQQTAERGRAVWALRAPLGWGTCSRGFSPVSAGGSGKHYVGRTQELATVLGPSHAPSVVVATPGTTSLPMPSSASSSIIAPLQSQTRFTLMFLLHRPMSPRFPPFPPRLLLGVLMFLVPSQQLEGAAYACCRVSHPRSTRGHQGVGIPLPTFPVSHPPWPLTLFGHCEPV